MKHSFIKKNEEFRAISTRGKNKNSLELAAKYSRGKTENIRLGVVIPKSKIPLAVKRNRIKRIIKEAFRSIKDHAKEPIDIVVYAKASAKDLGFVTAAAFLKEIAERP